MPFSQLLSIHFHRYRASPLTIVIPSSVESDPAGNAVTGEGAVQGAQDLCSLNLCYRNFQELIRRERGQGAIFKWPWGTLNTNDNAWHGEGEQGRELGGAVSWTCQPLKGATLCRRPARTF